VESCSSTTDGTYRMHEMHPNYLVMHLPTRS
jgi:hypothetical protein